MSPNTTPSAATTSADCPKPRPREPRESKFLPPEPRGRASVARTLGKASGECTQRTVRARPPAADQSSVANPGQGDIASGGDFSDVILGLGRNAQATPWSSAGSAAGGPNTTWRERSSG